jgi:hypothetical protein
LAGLLAGFALAAFVAGALLAGAAFAAGAAFVRLVDAFALVGAAFGCAFDLGAVAMIAKTSVEPDQGPDDTGTQFRIGEPDRRGGTQRTRTAR